jgi:hypothetical protein
MSSEYTVEHSLEDCEMGRIVDVAKLLYDGQVIRAVNGDSKWHALKRLRQEVELMLEVVLVAELESYP